MPIALVRPPSSRLAEGQLTFQEREPVDADRARAQWDDYVAALRTSGFECVELAPAQDHPDGVFVEDTVVIVGGTAILTRPGTPSRAGEVASMKDALAALGIPIREIAAPGHLDGGDVLKIGDTIYVGRSSRTDDAGIDQFTAFADELGFAVVRIPVTRALHLKTTLSALPDGTIIGYAPLVDDPSMFAEFLPIPEPQGSAVLVLGDDAVLISGSAPGTAEVLRRRGLHVVTTSITEFEKVEGGVTCLSVRIR
ncbi:MAG: N(G),N(G)-dimethylarginine dimethylaminohydrolase [Actinobacteria bacterium]|nr:N(G),N(G)-dimethylarginine dimethylaminohydrolase [Actinomycetota bacterium]